MRRRPAFLRTSAAAVTAVLGAAACTLGLLSGTAPSSAATTTAARAAANPVTPGDLTGYGFDQCLAPTQKKMDRWLATSPYLAVGIYISGDSRACRDQPNLTPAWVRTQLRKGWRLLPITLGPQASCQPRFPRYGDDETINPKPGRHGKYALAKQMGRAEAQKAVDAATALGIVPGSTLWYDLEGYDNSDTHCRESALQFLSGWSAKLHELGFVSGVYSSAGSGIRALDDARVTRPGAFVLPDAIWIARWDGMANTSTSYIREDGWRPGGRVKQYQGGHDESWGGVRINIDRNFLDLGRGSVADPEVHCGGVSVDARRYVVLRPATGTTSPDAAQVSALQCLLKEQGVFTGKVNGTYGASTVAAARRWQADHGFTASDTWSRRHWMSLVTTGTRPVVKVGSAGEAVRRVQRALNAASDTSKLTVDGVFGASTTSALKAWQKSAGLAETGVVAGDSWTALAAGTR